jgi:hypothetical protein
LSLNVGDILRPVHLLNSSLLLGCGALDLGLMHPAYAVVRRLGELIL